MQTEDLISADEFCTHHKIEVSFIQSLNEYGLIETRVMEEKIFLSSDQLRRLEMIVRFYHEMDINLEGIETITHLLDRMKRMQERINQLTNQLKRFETK